MRWMSGEQDFRSLSILPRIIQMVIKPLEIKQKLPIEDILTTEGCPNSAN